MKNGYRLFIRRGNRVSQFAFGKHKDVYLRAKVALQRHRRAWPRGQAVSKAAWSAMIKDMKEYSDRAAIPTASDRISLRWDTVPFARATADVCLTGRVLLVSVCRHRGVDLNIEDGIGDITLCHRVARMTARVGDLVVGITAVACKGAARRKGPLSRWPPAYHAAIQAAWPRRRVVWIAAISSVLDEYTYHAGGPHGRRTTMVYKRNGKYLLKHRIRRKYDFVPPPGRNGPTLVSTSFVRYPADLEDAPYVPATHVQMYRRISLGRDRICPAPYAGYYTRLYKRV